MSFLFRMMYSFVHPSQKAHQFDELFGRNNKMATEDIGTAISGPPREDDGRQMAAVGISFIIVVVVIVSIIVFVLSLFSGDEENLPTSEQTPKVFNAETLPEYAEWHLRETKFVVITDFVDVPRWTQVAKK